uniref:Putative secreted protein n=1 Tax=Panstrongylus lignarius TaxID=156445 RepID=A0A224XU12_9HEMI
MRFALWLSFSHAAAKICSACTDVKCAGVGRPCSGQVPPASRPLLFLRQDFKYVLILFLARSPYSGNCLVHESMIAWIFSFGCFDIGTDLSRFSSTNKRTNILNAFNLSES